MATGLINRWFQISTPAGHRHALAKLAEQSKSKFKWLKSSRSPHLTAEHLFNIRKQWNDMLNTGQDMHWFEEELEVIRAAIAKNTFCEVRIEGKDDIFQTVILGIDADVGRLFTDEIFPCPSYSLNHCLLQLRIPNGEQYLILEVLAQRANHGDAVDFCLKVTSKSLTRDRRLSPRVTFSGELCPKVKLLLPCQGCSDGALLNLSRGGCLIRTVGQVIHFAERQTGECTIELTAELTLKLRLKIKQVERQRHQASYCFYRATFIELSETHKEQLSVFIDNLTCQPYHVRAETINEPIIYE